MKKNFVGHSAKYTYPDFLQSTRFSALKVIAFIVLFGVVALNSAFADRQVEAYDDLCTNSEIAQLQPDFYVEGDEDSEAAVIVSSENYAPESKASHTGVLQLSSTSTDSEAPDILFLSRQRYSGDLKVSVRAGQALGGYNISMGLVIGNLSFEMVANNTIFRVREVDSGQTRYNNTSAFSSPLGIYEMHKLEIEWDGQNGYDVTVTDGSSDTVIFSDTLSVSGNSGDAVAVGLYREKNLSVARGVDFDDLEIEYERQYADIDEETFDTTCTSGQFSTDYDAFELDGDDDSEAAVVVSSQYYSPSSKSSHTGVLQLSSTSTDIDASNIYLMTTETYKGHIVVSARLGQITGGYNIAMGLVIGNLSFEVLPNNTLFRICEVDTRISRYNNTSAFSSSLGLWEMHKMEIEWDGEYNYTVTVTDGSSDTVIFKKTISIGAANEGDAVSVGFFREKNLSVARSVHYDDFYVCECDSNGILTGAMTSIDYLSKDYMTGWYLSEQKWNGSTYAWYGTTSPYSAECEDESLLMDYSLGGMSLEYIVPTTGFKRVLMRRIPSDMIYYVESGMDEVSGIGLWVYGNDSNDELKFPDNDAVTIDWTGWKYVEFWFPEPTPPASYPSTFDYLEVNMPSGSTGSRDPLCFRGMTPLGSVEFSSTPGISKKVFDSRLEGTRFELAVDVPNGSYTVELGIAPSESTSFASQTGFQVRNASDTLLFTYNPATSGGPWWTFPVTVSNGKIVLKVATTTDYKAWLNGLNLYSSTGKDIFFNLGEDVSDTGYFEGTNLAPNPGFEADDNLPIGWEANSSGAIEIDNNVSHSGTNSLCIPVNASAVTIESTTSQFDAIDSVDNYGAAVDYGRTYRYSAWVKGDASAGTIKLELAWTRSKGDSVNGKWNIFAELDALSTSQGTAVTPNSTWQKIELVATPPSGANFVKFRLVTNAVTAKIWVDDIMFDGFGDASAEVIGTQGGYHSDSEKKMLVASRQAITGTATYAVKNASTSTTVHSGNLTKWGTDDWGREIWIADFSSFTTSGTTEYKLEASFNSGTITATSEKFTVNDNIYTSYMDKVRHYLYVARCGMAITGWHVACHLDDGGNTADLTGGWHDAGSLDKQMDCTTIITNLATMLLESPDDFSSTTVDSLSIPSLFDELMWGADFLLRMQKNDGEFYDAIIPNSSYGDLVDSQDGTRGNADDRTIIDHAGEPRSNIVLALTRTARVLDAKSDSRLTTYMTAINRSYDIMCNDSGALKVDIDMYLLTDDNDYKTAAEDRCDALLDRIEARNYYDRAPDYVLLESLIEYALAFPNDTTRVNAIDTEITYLIDNVIEPFTEMSPYGHVMNWNLTFPHALDGWLEHNFVTMPSASFLAQAYRVTNDSDHLDLAENQIMWITGRNPMNNSMMGGVGTKLQMPCTAIAVTATGHEDGVITGAILRASWAGNGQLNTASGGGLPNGFPIIYTSSTVPGHMRSGGEIWSPISGMFMRTCYELDQARN